MKKILYILAAITITVIGYSQSKESSVAVDSIPTLAASSIRLTSLEVSIGGTNSGSATVNIEAWGDGQVIRRKTETLTKAQMTTWYANGAKEADLTLIATTSLGLTKK